MTPDDYQNLPQETKDRMAWSRGKLLTSRGFVENSTLSNEHILRHGRRNNLFKEDCYECHIKDWNGKPIRLELDHINGVNHDNRLENLRLLCPNCHSQTDTFRGRNINSGKIKVSDEDLIAAIQKSKNIRRTLIAVGLTPKGGNYTRVQELVIKHQLKFRNS